MQRFMLAALVTYPASATTVGTPKNARNNVFCVATERSEGGSASEARELSSGPET
jgi:hypothetical protein